MTDVKPGQLFKLAADDSRRPVVFEAVEVVTGVKHPYVRAWELEGASGRRYRRQTRSIAVAKVGAVLPAEIVRTYGDL